MFNSGFFNTIILLGAVQGFIIISLLFFSKQNRQSSRLLSALIFLMSLASTNLYLANKNWFGHAMLGAVADAFLPLVVIMPMGPLIFFYVQSSLDPSFRMSKKQRWHFLPVILDVFQHIVVIVYFIGVIFGLIRKNDPPVGAFLDSYNTYVDIPRWISVTTYLWLSAKYISRMKIRDGIDMRDQSPNLRWLQQFVRIFLAFQVIWLLHLIPYEIPRYSEPLLDWGNWYPLYVPLAVLIYWLGIRGYLVTRQDMSTAKKTPAQPLLPAATIQETVFALRKSMEEDKIYLNPALNLALLSARINVPQKIISSVLNQHVHKSFNEFVNEYRVEAFKEKIQQADMDHLTIAGIASGCGFSSQATFQRTFRQFTGMSPSEFRSNLVSL